MKGPMGQLGPTGQTGPVGTIGVELIHKSIETIEELLSLGAFEIMFISNAKFIYSFTLKVISEPNRRYEITTNNPAVFDYIRIMNI